MFDFLHAKMLEVVPLTTEEFDQCKTFFMPKKLRKKRFLFEEGEVCRYTAFVEKGTLKHYKVDDKGTEHILQFALEGWWVADLYSFFTQVPSIYNVEAIEDCELLLITKNSWEEMLTAVPRLERFFRILLQNNLIATQKRLMGAFSETAEEKYLKLINHFPDVLQRVPQHMIASYLGVTRETLSRVRSTIASKK